MITNVEDLYGDELDVAHIPQHGGDFKSNDGGGGLCVTNGSQPARSSSHGKNGSQPQFDDLKKSQIILNRKKDFNVPKGKNISFLNKSKNNESEISPIIESKSFIKKIELVWLRDHAAGKNG